MNNVRIKNLTQLSFLMTFNRSFLLLILLSFALLGCKDDTALEEEISKIDIQFEIERFDRDFAMTTPDNLDSIKAEYPFLFPDKTPDSVWIARMTDPYQIELNEATSKVFPDFNDQEAEISKLFQHLKYYDKVFKEPRVITYTNFVQYRDKAIVTDTIVLIAIDNYLGKDHEFYGGIPRYIAENLEPSQITVDLAKAYAQRQIFQLQKKTLLDDMIYFGKQLYFMDKMIPFKTDAEKIGYSQEQLDFAKVNEGMIWTYFVEKELLFDTDSSLSGRFIADAPFTKFYLELDSETPGRLGQYIGWQIVRAYMENNEVSLQELMQKEAKEIFNKSNYKPPK